MTPDIQLSVTGRITHPPRLFPEAGGRPAMWSAKLAVNGPPQPGRDGSPYIPTRPVEVVIYGLAAVRAETSYAQGDYVVVQACDLVVRTFESKEKDENGDKIVRAVLKITATAIGLCTRYTAATQADSAWPPGQISPRLVQGAATPTLHKASAAA